MFGKRLSEYVSVAKPVLAAIAVVWALRLGLSLAGVPLSVGRFASVTTVVMLGALYYGWTVQRSGFGSYRHVYALCLLQGLFSQTLIALAIVLAMATGQDNIYTVPEYYPSSRGGTPFPTDGKNIGHALAHVVLAGGIFLPLVTWAMGSLALLVARKSAPAAAGQGTRDAA